MPPSGRVVFCKFEPADLVAVHLVRAVREAQLAGMGIIVGEDEILAQTAGAMGLDIGSENSSSRVELGYYGVFSEHSTLHGLGVNWTMRF